MHKWIKRYQTIGGNEWYKSISRTPKQIQGKTPSKTEDLVIRIRKNFEGRIYSQTGALSIMYEFERLGLKPPSIATINRILKRNNQINKSSVKQKKTEYPNYFILVQQEESITVQLKKKRNLPLILEVMSNYSRFKYSWLKGKNVIFEGATYS